jgi:hypothetical protein
MDIQLDYVWYEPLETSAAQLQHAVSQLRFCVLRLARVVRRLEGAAEEQIDWLNAGSTMDDIQFYAEAFLTAMYELRERLSFLLAQLTGLDKETLIRVVAQQGPISS